MPRLPLALAFALLASPALAGDAAPDPCCTLKLSQEETQVVLNALSLADIRAATTNPLSTKILGQAQTQMKASQDYAAAHAPKPPK